MSNCFPGIFLCGVLISWIPAVMYGQIQRQLNWEELPSIPDREGFAGMYTGVSGGALICMGGANFPDGMPWEGGKKIWYDHIYILEKGATSWKLSNEKLPRPMAYGVSVTYNNRIILAGGSDATRHYADVLTVAYENGTIRFDTLASMPSPLANMTGALTGDHLFIAGGHSNAEALPLKTFLSLKLSGDRQAKKWLSLEPWPGPARMQAVSASLQDKFFLFSGIDLRENTNGERERIILKDAYQFTPGKSDLVKGTWVKLSDMPRGTAAGASPAPTVGSDHILFPGGLDGKTAQHKDPSTFPGFVTDLLAYHVQSDKWLNFGKLPANSTRVTVPAVKWDQKWVIINGEVGPGKRSSKVFALSKTTGFGWLNWLTLAAYLALMVWFGFLFDKKDQTTSNFFTAGGKIPWWAAGISIYGTQLSAITFMAIPAIVFATDWAMAIGSVMILGTVPIVVKYYIPFFRRLSVTSAYQYLEYRFNSIVRTMGSLSFILYQLGRMGIVLFLPAAAIASVTGIDIYSLIAIMGVICILYTVMGGIEAVIWADVIQVVILVGGAILCLVIGIWHVEGGLASVITKGMEADKFNLYHWGWGQDRLYLYIGIIGFFFLNLIPYTSDQTIVQRYITVKDEKAVAKSLYTNGLITIPGIFIFYGLGTVLYIFYQDNPGIIPSESVGEILPYFIIQQLPAGVAGLIIAGIFAASQSTMSSSMNSVAAAYNTDIHFRLVSGKTDKQKLQTARIATIVAGGFGIASAMLTAWLNIEFIFNYFQEVLGIFGGSLAGVFILGIFIKRSNSFGAVIGLLAGVVTVLLIKQIANIHPYLYGAISICTCVLIGYFASLFFPPKKELKGLTYATLNDGDKGNGRQRTQSINEPSNNRVQ
ncbi:MAG: sodium/solute symporter [Cyclobacteriaceae bacterium]